MIFMTPCNWCCGRAYLMEVGSWQGQVGDPRCSILQMDIALWVPFRASGPFCGISFSRYCIWYVWYAWSFLPGFIYGWESGHSQSLGVHPTIFLSNNTCATQYSHLEYYRGSHFPVFHTRQQKLWVKLTGLWQSFPQTRGLHRVLRRPACQTQCHCHGQLRPTFDRLKVQNHQLSSSALKWVPPSLLLGWEIPLQPFDLTQQTEKKTFWVLKPQNK